MLLADVIEHRQNSIEQNIIFKAVILILYFTRTKIKLLLQLSKTDSIIH